MKNTKKWKLKQSTHIVAHTKNRVEIRSGVWNYDSVIIEDEHNDGVLLNILQMLNGKITNEEIADMLSISQSKIESIIDSLEQYGLVTNNDSNILDCYLSISSSVYQAQYPISLQYEKVLIIGHETIAEKLISDIKNIFPQLACSYLGCDSDEVVAINEMPYSGFGSGIETEEMLLKFKTWENCFIVYAEKTHNPSFCLKLNSILFALSIDWVFATIDGPFVIVGPAFIEQNICFECLEHRVYMNLKNGANYQKYKNLMLNITQGADDSISIITMNLLSSHLLLEVANLCTTKDSFVKNKIFTIYLPTMEIRYHDVLRMPHCKTCGASVQISKEPYFTLEAIINEN